jgi:DNA-binding transcriptional ArsR family regulator
MVNYRSDSLDGTFAALVDPTRRAILARLAAMPELSVSQIAQPFAIKLPAITKHLTVLHEAGLITRSKVGRTVYCQLAPAGLKRAARWLERTSSFWETRLDNLEHVLESKRGRRESGRHASHQRLAE